MDALFQELLHFDSPWSIFFGTVLAAATYVAAWLPLLNISGGRGERKERRPAAEKARRGHEGKKEQAPAGDLNEIMGYEFIRRRSALAVREDGKSRGEQKKEAAGSEGNGQEEQVQQPPVTAPVETGGITMRAAERHGREDPAERMMSEAERDRERLLKSNRALNERMERERSMKAAADVPEQQDELPIIDDMLTDEEQELIETMRYLDEQTDGAAWREMTTAAERRQRPKLTARQIAALTGGASGKTGGQPSGPTPEEMLAMEAAEADISRELKGREKGLTPSMRDTLAAIRDIGTEADRSRGS